MGGGGGGGGESSSSPAAAAASPSSKRGRDPEDDVYLDNLHSQKRYLSEIMASSLNGLSVGDTLSENLMESPARSDSLSYPRDEIAFQYSPMSEDSDDCRYCDTPLNPSTTQTDPASSPSSPVSPYRYPKPYSAPSPTNTFPLPSCNLSSVVCSHPRRGDSEGRFPSSPNDMCHVADLRKAALLRSVQMRTQPHCPPPYELPFSSGQESIDSFEEGDDRPDQCVKSQDDEAGYHSPEHEADYIEDCSSADGTLESKFSQD
ncbi:hypothetical protein ACMD2_02414 [Ananas comosus]|uniref:Uncharacterized protein n=1 Tax=Ananas comosus TaxID=4615 RepID=A0A199UWV2_ANACO|nr:hypothetical protein ACMD2_02414 [Ananas comosus]